MQGDGDYKAHGKEPPFLPLFHKKGKSYGYAYYSA